MHKKHKQKIRKSNYTNKKLVKVTIDRTNLERILKSFSNPRSLQLVAYYSFYVNDLDSKQKFVGLSRKTEQCKFHHKILTF